MYVAQFPTVTWTLDKTLTRDIIKFRQATWDPPPGRPLILVVAWLQCTCIQMTWLGASWLVKGIESHVGTSYAQESACIVMWVQLPWSISYLCCKLLQATNVNRSFLWGIQVTTTNTKVTGRAHHATWQTQWVITEDCLSSSIIVLHKIKRKILIEEPLGT